MKKQTLNTEHSSIISVLFSRFDTNNENRNKFFCLFIFFYSMFNVGCSMFIFFSPYLCKNRLVLIGACPLRLSYILTF